MADQPPIIVSSKDLERLEHMLEISRVRNLPGIDALYEELARATVVAPDKIPPGVVTMNSTVRCIDDSTGKTFELTLVYPPQADAENGKVSILAPVGSALLGLSPGQTIEWPAPNGRKLKVRVLEVVYQPEAAGDYES